MLFFQRMGMTATGFVMNEPYGQTAPGIAGRSAVVMLLEAASNVPGDARIQRAVAALDNVEKPALSHLAGFYPR